MDDSTKYSAPSSKKQLEKESALEKFKGLSHEQQRKIINELIFDQAPVLKDRFPEIQSFSAMRKKINNKPQNYYSIHIDVVEKINKLGDDKKIPAFIEHIAKDDNRYSIPTDVSGVGVNKLSRYIGEGEMPKQLGLSCSRIKNNPSGTIGLKVYKKEKPETSYLLSCFHVLCAPELKRGETVFSPESSAASSHVIVSPGSRDAADKNKCVPIASVTEGYLKRNLDVAIARLNSDAVLKNSYYDDNGTPRGVVDVNSENVAKQMDVHLIGRTSETSFGKLQDSYRAIVYIEDYPAEKINHLQGLIVTDKISKPGDSGATIMNNKNEVVGILVGSNSKQSFIMPINSILNQLHLNVY